MTNNQLKMTSSKWFLANFYFGSNLLTKWLRINEKWLKCLIGQPNFIDQLHIWKKFNLKMTNTKNISAPILCQIKHLEKGHLNWNINFLDPNCCGEKSNKCNLCDYVPSRAGNLKTQLKTQRGEKTEECNQCDYASPYVSNLRAHMKTHSGEM